MPDSTVNKPLTSNLPPASRGWIMVCAALFFQSFTLGIYTYCFTFWILPWSEEFNAPRSEIMIALMLGNILMSFMSPFVGRSMDKKPVQYVVAFGIAMFAVGMVVISQATAIWQIIAAYALLLSLGCCASGPIAGQWLAVHWIHDRRGTALGLVSIGSSIGGFLLPPVVTWLMGDFGWRATHLILAAVALVVFVPFSLAFIRSPDKQLEVEQTPEEIASKEPIATLTTPDILKSRNFWLIVITLMPLIISIIVFTANLAPFTADLGIDPQKASLLMSAFAFGMIGGKLGAGILTDLMDFRTVYFVLIAILIAGLGGMAVKPGYLVLLISCGLIGISAGSFLTMAASIVGNLYKPESFGSVLGLLYLCNGWTAVMIPVSGLLRESLGNYTPIWIGLIVLSIVAALFMPTLKPTARTAS